MNDANKAVFLSYASQDAEAARRICDSLRSAGVEVWFDADGGLEHGDEWDAKIRRQIKECVLFIPIISANTEARLEGYFRLEWELASERAMTIASGVAFILPVVIDDTREPDALVPDRFRKVQWTRLPGGEVRPDVRARLLKLWSHRTGALARASPAAASLAGPLPVVGSGSRRFGRQALVGGMVASLVLASALGWSFLRPKAAGRAGPATTRVNVSDVDRLIAQALAFFDRTNYTRADIAAAAVLARKATDLAPDSAEAWATRAFVQAVAVWRVWDRSDQRLQDLETFAHRALAIDPKQVRAMIALGELYAAQQAWAQAEDVARRGIELQPDSPHLYRILAGALENQGRLAEAITLRQECVRKFPRDPLTHYGLGFQLMWEGDFAGALRSFEQALAIEIFGSALLNKVRVLVAWKGDLAGARAAMDQIPLRDRTEIRAIGVAMWLGLLERRLDRVQAAAGLTAETYLTDGVLAAHGPKALPLGLAYHLDGKPALAQQQWQAAEMAARARQRDYPGDERAPIHLAIALAWLGRTEEAAREVAASEAAVREQAGARGRIPNAVLVARYYAARGEAAPAASLLRLANSSIETSPQVLSLEPWWDKIRRAPEFQALLTETTVPLAASPPAGGARPAASPGAPNPRSIAVLAFDNRSDDKANEYFSDGLSEELINVLGRVAGLTVKGSTSSFYFKAQKNASSAEIAQQLGVAYLVRGSVSKVGNQVRIAAQLTRAATDELVWSCEPQVRPLENAWAVQEEIAGLIARNLSLKLGASSPAAIAPVDPRVLELYLQGRQAWNLRTAAGFDRAEELLQRALGLDPKFARAHAALADVWGLRGQGENASIGRFAQRQDAEPARVIAKAREALALDASSAEAHTALGAMLWSVWDFAAAESELRRAIALNPSYGYAHQILGRVLACHGLMDESLAELRQAAELDPLSTRALSNYASTLKLAGRFTEALAAYDHALSLRSDDSQALGGKALLIARLGRFDEAIALARQVRSETSSAPYVQVIVLAAAGRIREAEALGAHTATDSPLRYALLRGQRAEAIAMLNSSQLRAHFIQSLLFDSDFDAIREEVRFRQVLNEVGLVESHRRAQAWRAAHPPEKPDVRK